MMSPDFGRRFCAEFAFGVVTGIPLEFQFGTNWAKFSTSPAESLARRCDGSLFAFFLESLSLGIPLSAKCFGPRVQWCVALMLFLARGCPVIIPCDERLDAASGRLHRR